MTSPIDHPRKSAVSQYAEVIGRTAGEAESLRWLHDDQVRLIHEQGWLNMYVPKEFGGSALSLPEILRTEEGLAWMDGSIAWVVTLCSGAAWFTGFLDPALTEEIFADEKVCFAGSGGITGTASSVQNGYVINGSWKYASGSPMATVFTANCRVVKDGIPLYNDDGTEMVKAFLLKRREVVCQETWNSMGMVATASHSFEVRNLKVQPNRCFTIDAAYAVLSHPVFQYPFLPLAETTLAVNLSGMALRFADLAAPLVSHNPKAYTLLLEEMGKLEEARQAFYTAAEASWQECVTRRHIHQALLTEVSERSHTLVRVSRTLVDTVYPYCGLKAADLREEINRVWRNFHTATQHALFNRSSS